MESQAILNFELYGKMYLNLFLFAISFRMISEEFITPYFFILSLMLFTLLYWKVCSFCIRGFILLTMLFDERTSSSSDEGGPKLRFNLEMRLTVYKELL